MLLPPNDRRDTRQRKTILDIVQASHSHPSAEDIHTLARKAFPTLSLGTVYRNLKLLAEEGKIREVQFVSDVTRYDGMLEEHEHFYCTKCGAVTDLTPTISQRNLAGLEKKLSAKIQNYKMDYYGLCKTCRKSSL